MITLSELQRDALGELFNIGVGRAAAALSAIVGGEVELSAPNVELIEPVQLKEHLLGNEFRQLSAVSQQFTGPFDAEAILLFPERNALTIVGRMLGEEIPPEELAEYEQEAMCEVGNIILNACVSALGDQFETEFSGSLPVHRFSDSESLELGVGADQAHILLLQIKLDIREERIEGHLLFLLEIRSLTALLQQLDQYLVRQGLA